MRTEVTSRGNVAEDVRKRILETASELFYKQGVRAVGVDLVVKEAGVSKPSLYRHFRTKDELVAAFLDREDTDFWAQWDSVAAQYGGNPEGELAAHISRIGERVGRQGYRGCPQINVAAEFPDEDHPARKVAAAHKRELRRRLTSVAAELEVSDPRELGGQLAVLINGAFVSSQMFDLGEARPLLACAVNALVAAARQGEGVLPGNSS